MSSREALGDRWEFIYQKFQWIFYLLHMSKFESPVVGLTAFSDNMHQPHTGRDALSRMW